MIRNRVIYLSVFQCWPVAFFSCLSFEKMSFFTEWKKVTKKKLSFYSNTNLLGFRPGKLQQQIFLPLALSLDVGSWHFFRSNNSLVSFVQKIISKNCVFPRRIAHRKCRKRAYLLWTQHICIGCTLHSYS